MANGQRIQNHADKEHLTGVDTGCFWHWYADFMYTYLWVPKSDLKLKIRVNVVLVFW